MEREFASIIHGPLVEKIQAAGIPLSDPALRFYPDGSLTWRGLTSFAETVDQLLLDTGMGGGPNFRSVAALGGGPAIGTVWTFAYAAWYANLLEKFDEMGLILGPASCELVSEDEHDLSRLRVCVELYRNFTASMAAELADTVEQWFTGIGSKGVFGESGIKSISQTLQYGGREAAFQIDASGSGQDTLNTLYLAVLDWGMAHRYPILIIELAPDKYREVFSSDLSVGLGEGLGMDDEAEFILDDMNRHLKAAGFSTGFPREAGCAQMGFYLGWAIQRGNISEMMRAQWGNELSLFQNKEMTGRQIVMRMGGVLSSCLFNETVAQFSQRYYLPKGRCLPDYVYRFVRPIVKSRSMYVVEDKWENQEHLSSLLDERLEAWRDYPPAAQNIFGAEVGVGCFYQLEMVSQVALVTAARAITGTGSFQPFAVFLAADGEIYVPGVLSDRGQSFTVETEEGIARAGRCLREGLALRTIKAFATARLAKADSDPAKMSIQVMAQHYKSGPHSVFGPYASNGAGSVKFERPLKK